MKTEKVLAFGLIAYALTQRKTPRVVPPPRPSVPYQPNNSQSYQVWLAWTQQVLRQAQAAYGSFEKAYQALWGPGGIFYKEPLPKYDAGSLFWQEATAGLAGVGRIYKTAPPGKNLCADGTYSDLSGRGVCSRHGGVFLKKAKSRSAADAERNMAEVSDFILTTTIDHATISEINYYSKKHDITPLFYKNAVTYLDKFPFLRDAKGFTVGQAIAQAARPFVVDANKATQLQEEIEKWQKLARIWKKFPQIEHRKKYDEFVSNIRRAEQEYNETVYPITQFLALASQRKHVKLFTKTQTL